MVIIYILQCQNGKYYVGKTDDLATRLQKHFEGHGSIWTQRYRPIRVVNTYSCYTSFDEDKFTKIYMKKYGIQNVRGGSYTQMKISSTQKHILQHEIKGASNACYQCGQ